MTSKPITKKFEFGFAIGCFCFTSKLKEINTIEFVKELETFLNKQINISKVNIDGHFDSERIHAKNLSKEESESNDSPFNWHPIIPDLNIKFELFLPEKNQAEIIPAFRSIGTERFHVYIKYSSWGLPVAFVKTCDVKKINPYYFDQNVCVVREFLSNLFTQSKTIHFRYLGPSPAHLDIAVYSAENLGMNFCEELIGQTGYRDIDYIFNPSEIEITEFENYIYESLLTPFSIYYEFMAYRNQVLYQQYNYCNNFENMLNKLKEIKFYNLIKQYITIPNLIHQTFISLTEFELARIRVKQYIARSKVRMKDLEKDIFKNTFEYIDDEFKEIDIEYSEELKPYYDAINFHESRNQHLKQITIVMVSAIIGAIIGAAISCSMK